MVNGEWWKSKVRRSKVDEASRGRDEEGLRRALRLNSEFRIVNAHPSLYSL
jgi:hypothetical protein